MNHFGVGDVWTRQDFSSSLIGSNVFHPVSNYGMGNQDQKSSGLLLACLLLVTCLDVHPKDWPALYKENSLYKNSLQIICSFLFHHGYLIMVDGTQAFNLRSAYLPNLGQISSPYNPAPDKQTPLF